MADCIKLLPDIVANQIKAGEVVESPSSVVKEMMENAIDAGATSVTVNYVNGGRDLLQIIDNGRGMSPADARMAFECHATSKIASLEDIYALHTFGFRGEALSSIAAVSQVELLTRPHDSEIGTRTLINGGEFVSQTPVATPAGSQFLVRNIFYNTPARRKFIDKKEERLVQDIKREFRRVALCHPEVALELMNNGTPIYTLPEAGLAERIVDIMGDAMKRHLLEVDASTSIVKIEGYVGRPSAARRGGEHYMFVNGRFFASTQLKRAVLRAYDKLIPEGAEPSFFLYLTVDADRVDVNVHAKKTEVKFADEEAIWQILNAAVRETLAKSGAVPLMDFETEECVEIPVPQGGVLYPEPRATINDNYNPFAGDVAPRGISGGAKAVEHEFDIVGINDNFGAMPFVDLSLGGADDGSTFEIIDVGESEQFLEFESPELAMPQSITFVGRRYATMLLGGRLMLVDLARARERILYDGYMTMLGGGHSVTQQLLYPERLTVTAEEFDLMEEYAVDFAALGFDIRPVENCTVEVYGVPADASSERIDTAIYSLLQTLRSPQSVVEARREALAATLAHSESLCRERFTQQDAERLIVQLCSAGNISYTPTGKQIMAEITPDEMQTKLG